MLNWVTRFGIFCFLDNQQYGFSNPAFECLLAAGSKKSIRADAGNAFDQLRHFYDETKGEWLFGHFGYDLKNEIESLQSHHADKVGFGDLHFFVPEWVIRLDADEVKIYGGGDLELVYGEICSCSAVTDKNNTGDLKIKHKISRKEYLAIIERLRQHILRGDCYEINFCQEFFAEDVEIDPLSVYNQLTELSPNPFSVFYKLHDRYCICASPERYLKKSGSRIFSQPIKGTSKREHDSFSADETSKNYLLQSDKEKSENVMVVDLVRNDLSRICKPGSVIVDELFGLYSFPQVHQMISTVSGEIEESASWIDCIRETFPMGSMTGAPKKKVMELIEQYEHSRRGLFSGAIGYMDPAGDFDFNVVIRSMFYNAEEKYLSFQTGGGITYYSDPADEYEESLLKAEAMMKVFQ
ncbi:MAG: anthranilate synthase component I family protein [Chitinophagaceae bacterium]|nr:anthranilate synthase component I family protein [Chitinophagaceae bacterium]